MLFNSFEFAIFLPIVFVLYWFVANKNLRFQNFLLLIASYVFYGWWDWKFLSLIIISSVVDYFVGLGLATYENINKRRILLFTSIAVNIGILGFFKYFNFFIESFIDAFSLMGQSFNYQSLSIILPVGISFYTFQTLSYSIDVYNKKITPTKDLISFFAFVSFFPQLVAGPIERATNLLPQFYKRRVFDYDKASDGMRQILWGLFKKIVIADNCAKYVNDIFGNYADYSGSTLVIGAVFFAFQIYGDFSGYSDIAIGTARLFGFNLMRNFAFPYFSRDIAEFWRRWHISLSSWFRDYVYIPLGGSRVGLWKKIRNIFVIFVVSGFWHGANWTFIAWGALNAIYFLPLMLAKKNRENTDIVADGRLLPTIREFFQIISTFILTIFAWIFFRSNSIHDSILYLGEIFSSSILSKPYFVIGTKIEFGINMFLLFLFIFVEWFQRNKQHALQIDNMNLPIIIRWGTYYILVALILWFVGSPQEFIYFQF